MEHRAFRRQVFRNVQLVTIVFGAVRGRPHVWPEGGDTPLESQVILSIQQVFGRTLSSTLSISDL